MGQLQDKVAVVTGAASGIGRGLARKAASEGMRVVLADVEPAALTEAEEELAVMGAETLAVPTDVSDASAVESLASAAFDRFGAVHLVFLNAGVFQAGVSWQRTEADWDWVLGVNLWGPIHGVRSFVPRLVEQGGPAHVVITSSMAGMMTVAYSGPYVVSKFGAASVAECVAHDLRAQGSEVGVSCLVPGAVDTKIGWSERNRQATTGTEAPGESQAPDHYFVREALQDMTATAGRPPDEVAEIVFAGVRAGQFWITTMEEDGYQALVRGRYDALLDHALPPSAGFA
jgi:NAD(P)-dependent dehydrogenase (short-subunit alcohol dehydrogenase family)